MNWPILLWSMNVGICLALAGVHVLAWVKSRSAWMNLAFAIFAASVGSVALFEMLAMRAYTPAEYGDLVRWAHVPVGTMVCSLVWFIRLYLQAGRRWLLWSIYVVRGLVLVVNFVSGANVNFREITSLRYIPFWGETAAVPVGVMSHWDWLIRVSELLILLFVLDAAVGAWRQGKGRQAVVMGASLVCALLVAASFSTMFTHGNLPAPMTVSMSFMILMVVMGYEVSSDLVRARRLSSDLEQSQKRMRLATQAAGLAIWEWEVDRDEVWVNEKGRELLSLQNTEKVDFSRFIESVHPGDRETIRKTVRQSLEDESELAMEYRVVSPSGRTRWLATHGRVERALGGTPHRLRGVAIEVTAEKQAESERLQLHLELAHLNRVMQMNELSTSLAHEINQPLGAILNNASAAKTLLSGRAHGKDEITDILDDIVQDANRAGRVVRSLRALVKKEGMLFEPLDTNAVVGEVVDILQSNIIDAQASVQFDLQPDLPPVRGSRIGVQQVLINLLVNALEAMRESPTKILTVRSAAQAPDEVTVSVRDTGVGLSGVDKDRVFDSFFTTKPDGLGMGLRISRSIIEEHGGRIWVEDTPDPGATFCYSLKVCRRESE